MKNIYITDLDHTFLRNDLSISAYTKNIWNDKAASSLLSVATARTYKKTAEFLDGICISTPMILLDGALIATMDKQVIDTKFIDREIADIIINEGARYGIYPFVLALNDTKELSEVFVHSSTLNMHQSEVLRRYAHDDNLVEEKKIQSREKNFKVVYMGEESLLRELHATLQTLFGDTLKFIIAPEAYVQCYFLTILHKDADKSHGIKSVQEHCGFDLNSLTVFGDNLNDLGMFALANTSVAVANAHEQLKEQADVILEHTNDEDGVAKYLAGVSE